MAGLIGASKHEPESEPPKNDETQSCQNGALKLLNRAALWLLARSAAKGRIAVPYRHPVSGWLLLRGDGTGFSLLGGAYPEVPELRFLNEVLQPGMVFLDVGANQGLYSVLAGRRVGKRGRVIAFEPAPAEYRKLRANVWINRLNHVTCEPFAVGAIDGQTGFYACEPRKGGFSGIKAPAEYLGIRAERIDVPLTTLDSYLDRAGLVHVDYLKIDVEGGELGVISGARRFLSGSGRPMIQIELADGRTSAWGYAARDIAFELLALRYQLFDLHGDRLAPHTVRDHYAYNDLIAVPEERVSAMARWVVTS